MSHSELHSDPSHASFHGALPLPYSVFLAHDYRRYLELYCAYNDDTRGLRRKMAAAASCQPSYLTLVLNEEAHFSLDQLYGVATFLGLNDLEWEFLNLLWLSARAAGKDLKAKYQKQL